MLLASTQPKGWELNWFGFHAKPFKIMKMSPQISKCTLQIILFVCFNSYKVYLIHMLTY